MRVALALTTCPSRAPSRPAVPEFAFGYPEFGLGYESWRKSHKGEDRGYESWRRDHHHEGGRREHREHHRDGRRHD